MFFLSRCLLVLVAFLVCGVCSPVTNGCDSANCTCHEVTHAHRPGCWVASTGSFRVCSFKSAAEAERIAHHCEKLRAELGELYGFESCRAKWQPQCEVYLFPNKQKYGAVVGRPAMETLGSSLVSPEAGAIKNRRIDLRSDVDNYLKEVLPHELTHVLIADHFRDGPPPLWYDEGLALLADSQAKQSLHLRDLRNGLDRGRAFSLVDLLNADRYPPADQVSVFYGQCVSVARCLSKRAGTGNIHEFARRSQEVGVNLALQETYAMEGVAQLETEWRKSLAATVPVIPAQYSPNSISD